MSGSPDRFRRLRELFDGALDHPAERRAEYLDRVTSDDPDLRVELESLLAAHERASSGTFSRPLADRLNWAGAIPVPSMVGRRLGAYRVMRELGEGGMGAVYEAVRADDQFDKRVAIKTLRSGLGTGSLLERFRREREIQAALSHPNIATLLDAGITDEGIPYLVLEYVDGVPIDTYCDERGLTLRQRLDLFRQVGRAVQHAHAQLVVHRDLKPSNVLVTGDGTVKLLDFGISKLLENDPAGTLTVGGAGFTPAYASPEQLQEGPVSTATDVYSLGALLFRLVTGRRPFEVDRAADVATWRLICDEPAPAPSEVATQGAADAMGLPSVGRLRKALRGELDAVVLMALRKEPTRRYTTVQAFLEDVEAYLRRRPVKARPDSAAYRLRMLVARNRLATAAVSAAVAALVVGATVAGWQAREARRSASQAERERQTAERVSAFLTDVFSLADPSWAGRGLGPSATLADAIDATAARVESELADEPEVAEQLHAVLSSGYAALGRSDEGLHHAEARIRLLDDLDAEAPARGRALHDLGLHLYLGGQADSALAVLERSHEVFVEDGFRDSEALVYTLNMLALLLWETRGAAVAEPYMREGLAMHERLNAEPAVAAIGHSNLGLMLDAQGDLDGAEQNFRRAIRIYESLRPREFFEAATNMNNLATVLTLRGDHASADSLLHEAEAVWTRTLGSDHWMIGVGRLNRARVELATGRVEQALATQRQGAALLSHYPPDHANTARRQVVEAMILTELGRLGEAERAARAALETRNSLHAVGDWRIAEAQAVLGRVLLQGGAESEARSLLERSYESMVASFGSSHPRTRAVARDLGSDTVP